MYILVPMAANTTSTTSTTSSSVSTGPSASVAAASALNTVFQWQTNAGDWISYTLDEQQKFPTSVVNEQEEVTIDLPNYTIVISGPLGKRVGMQTSKQTLRKRSVKEVQKQS